MTQQPTCEELAERIAKEVLAIAVHDECPTMEDHHQECEVRDRYNAWPAHYRDPITAHLEPLYAELERLKAENVELLGDLETLRKTDLILEENFRLRTLLGECRDYVPSWHKKLLTRIDAEIGGGDGKD